MTDQHEADPYEPHLHREGSSPPTSATPVDEPRGRDENPVWQWSDLAWLTVAALAIGWLTLWIVFGALKGMVG